MRAEVVAVRRTARFAPLMALGALLLAPVCSPAQTVLGTQTLNLNLNGAGLIYAVPATTPLTNSGTVFSNYNGSISITYRARTTVTTGTGAITLQALSGDFTPTGGPALASGALKYTCSGATLGTNCSGTQTVSTASATNVVTLPAAVCTGGGSLCSTANPNTVTINFTLTNDPQYIAGTGYSVTLTFTISAT